jgi:hypothetical protein
MQSTRRPFTESDDEHLAEYIAKNNPEVPGRHGNKLYETLVENVSARTLTRLFQPEPCPAETMALVKVTSMEFLARTIQKEYRAF